MVSLTRDFLTDIATLVDPQLDFVRAVHEFEYTLFGGSAGPGKTRTLVATGGYLSFQNGMSGIDVPGAFVSNDKKRIVERFMPAINELLIRPGLGNVFGATEKEPAGFRFFNRSVPPIYFVGLYDLAALGGRQFAFAGWDEMTQSEEAAFHELDWRVRFPHWNKPLPHDPMFGASNPDGVGNHWVTEYFIKKTFNTPLGENMVGNEHKFCFVPAKLSDNPNEEFRIGYEKKLLKLPTHLRDARLHGIWDAGVGVRFTHALNIIRWSDLPNSRIPDHWQRVIGFDWGFANDPAVAVWIAFDEQRNAYVYRVLKIQGKGIRACAEQVMSMNNGVPIYVFGADPTIFARTGNQDELRGLDTYFHPFGVTPLKSTNDHAITNALIEKYLEPENGHPDIFFVDGACSSLPTDLKALRFDSDANNPENLVPHAHTHTVYALGYGLHKAWPTTVEPTAHTPAERARVQRIERALRKAHLGKTGSIIGA